MSHGCVSSGEGGALPSPPVPSIGSALTAHRSPEGAGPARAALAAGACWPGRGAWGQLASNGRVVRKGMDVSVAFSDNWGRFSLSQHQNAIVAIS